MPSHWVKLQACLAEIIFDAVEDSLCRPLNAFLRVEELFFFLVRDKAELNQRGGHVGMFDDVKVARLSSATGRAELFNQVTANAICKLLTSAGRALAVVITSRAACFGACEAISMNRNKNVRADTIGDLAPCAKLLNVRGFSTLSGNSRIALAG